MTLRLSHRVLVPVVALAVLGGVMSTFMLTRLPRPTDEAPKVIKPRYAGKKPAKKPVDARPAPKPARAATAAPVKKQSAKPVVKARPKPASKAAAVPVSNPAPVPAAKPVERPKGDPVGANGLPLVLARALASNRVAVVALYDPRASLDELALAEARAGAVAAGAAFVAINVFSEQQSRPLAELLGVLENPSVLVYRRPSEVFLRIDGFADRDTVAQAAANARS